jgi:hypothetical protein
LAETINQPQEDARLQVPREFFLGIISGMEEAVQDCIYDLFFNLGEVGVSEWEDRKSKEVAIPSAMSGQTIHHEVNRNLKHVMVIICVAARAEHVLRDITTSQESDDLMEALRKKGIEFKRYLILKENQKPYVNSKSFAEYIKSISIPHITRICAARGTEQEGAVLLMDNCLRSHKSDMRNLVKTARVAVVIFALHNTQSFQLLDLTLFGIFARAEKCHLSFSDLGRRSISCTKYI